MYKLYKIFFLFVMQLMLLGQEISSFGNPYLENLSFDNTSIYPKFWEIKFAPNGIMYAVNEDGLIEWDGLSFESYEGSEGITRSLYIENDSLIYSGSDVDFGVWKKNDNAFHYESLYPLSKGEVNKIEEFWNTYKIRDQVIFQSAHNLYVYQNEILTKIPAPYRFEGSNQLEDQLILYDQKYGVYQFDGQNLLPLFNPEIQNIIAVYKRLDTYWIFSQDKGVFQKKGESISPLSSISNQELLQYKIFSVHPYGEHYWIIGTIRNGLYIINNQGEIIQHINKKGGLYNNTVLSIGEGPFGNIYTGLNFGVSKLHIQIPFQYYMDYNGFLGSSSSAEKEGNQFILGTNQGLYYTDFQNLKGDLFDRNFMLVPQSEGQVWTVKKLHNSVWVGHNLGSFIYDKGRLEKIHNEPGTWDLVSAGNRFIITGNYNGIHLLENKEGKWQYAKRIDGINGACIRLFFDESTHLLWILMGDNRVAQIILSPNFTIQNQSFYTLKEVNFENAYFENKNDILYLYTPEKIFRFNPSQKKFELLQTHRPEWIPYVNQNKSIPKKLNERFLFYGFENGFTLKDLQKKPFERPYPLVTEIRNIFSFNNEKSIPIVKGEEIPYNLNNLSFQFVIPQAVNALYRYRLNEGKWSVWTTNQNLKLLNTKEGSYTLEVEAKLGEKYAQPAIVHFEVKPPWARTIWAYIFYALLILLLFIGIRRWQNMKLKKQEIALKKREEENLRKQEEKYRESQLLQQKEHLEEENEKLQQEIKSKNKELSKSSTLVMNKNKVLKEIQEIIEKNKAILTPEINPPVAKIKRILNANVGANKDQFSVVFDESNEVFFDKLKQKHPKLTLNNLRLAAYIRAGFTSKEIAEIQNVLPSSVVVNRSRLRKKMKLKKEDNLYDYLNQF